MVSIVESLLEVRLAREQDFLKIKETLTRIGVSSRKEKRLYQSCHILHKRGSYYIVHFKELFMLDGKASDFTHDDAARRNTIASLLEEWGLAEIVHRDRFAEPRAAMSQIKIIPHKEKAEWVLESKYTVGRKRR